MRVPLAAAPNPSILAPGATFDREARMQFNFAGKRAIVTGGSRGIGRAIAARLAAAGASVSIAARGEVALAATASELMRAGGTVHSFACDLADAAAVQDYVAAAAEALGGIDILINTASAFGLADDEASWEASIAVDLLAAVRAARAAVPHLLRAGGGSIINIAS